MNSTAPRIRVSTYREAINFGRPNGVLHLHTDQRLHKMSSSTYDLYSNTDFVVPSDGDLTGAVQAVVSYARRQDSGIFQLRVGTNDLQVWYSPAVDEPKLEEAVISAMRGDSGYFVDLV